MAWKTTEKEYQKFRQDNPKGEVQYDQPIGPQRPNQDHVTIVPKGQVVGQRTYPNPEPRVQYNQPIGPQKQTTVERIRNAAKSAGEHINRAVSHPTVQKAGRIVKERSDTFQREMTGRPAPRQAAPRVAKPSRQYTKAGKIQAAPAPKPLAAQMDPFNIHGGNMGGNATGDPFGARTFFGGKKKPNDNPFGIGGR